MSRKRFWTCRYCGPNGIHHYQPRQCQNCNRADGIIETVKRPSLAAMIESAVSDEPVLVNSSKPKQLNLFDTPMA